MRCRRIAYRYAVAGDLSSTVAAAFWEVRPRGMASALWRPCADVYETDTTLSVTLEVAGVAEEEVEISVFADALVVLGRRHGAAEPDARWHESEIRCGPFRFEMALPFAIDPEHVAARLDRGLLQISLKKVRGAI